MNTNVELLKDFVTERFMDKQKRRQSCLVMALENARRLSGRDKDTGKSREACTYGNNEKYDVESKKSSGYIPELYESCLNPNNSFGTDDTLICGLIHYLILLDLIGNVFCSKKNAIHKALEEFSSIFDKKEQDAIYALRCCLAHNYGLTNKNENNQGRQHKFTLLLNDEEEMIKFPETSWKGDYTNKDETMSTQIDVCKLIDAIEEAYQNLKEMAEAGNLELCLDGKENELMARFTICT